LSNFEGGQEAVIDAFFEGVSIDGIAEVGVGVNVVSTFGGGGQAELNGGGKIFQDVSPGTFIVSTASVALIDDDEVKELGAIVAEVGGRVAWFVLVSHQGLEDAECNKGLVCKDVAIAQKQDAGTTAGLAIQVPAALE